ncbi:MAG: hypothetical protein K1X92_16280 [Bacteroidia bacterium]|nr:hypothetical protein [Bacteroidia bacterium]
MKKQFFLFICVSVFFLASCEQLGLTKKDFRDDLEGYYQLNEKCEIFSVLPDPPGGISKDENREIKVTKSDKDSTVIIEGKEYKLDKNFGYYKQQDFGGPQSYNYTLVKFFTNDKNDSLYMETATGSVSVYEVCKLNAAYIRGLD